MFGLLRNLIKKCRERRKGRKVNVLLVGLNGAGKSTLLSTLHGQPNQRTAPTMGFDTQRVQTKGCELTFFDVGGGRVIRGMWKSYFHESHGFIFMIDSSDPDRFEESWAALQKNLDHEYMAGKPILVMANKQDLPEALPPSEVAVRMELHERLASCDFHINPCVALQREGEKPDPNIDRGVQWLVDAIFRQWGQLDERVRLDTKMEHEKEEKRKEEQRARVAARKAERQREREEMERKMQEEAEGAGDAAGGSKEGEEMVTMANHSARGRRVEDEGADVEQGRRTPSPPPRGPIINSLGLDEEGVLSHSPAKERLREREEKEKEVREGTGEYKGLQQQQQQDVDHVVRDEEAEATMVRAGSGRRRDAPPNLASDHELAIPHTVPPSPVAASAESRV